MQIKDMFRESSLSDREKKQMYHRNLKNMLLQENCKSTLQTFLMHTKRVLMEIHQRWVCGYQVSLEAVNHIF